MDWVAKILENYLIIFGILVFLWINYTATMKYFDSQFILDQDATGGKTSSHPNRLTSGLFSKKEKKSLSIAAISENSLGVDNSNQEQPDGLKKSKEYREPDKSLKIWRKNILHVLELWNERIYRQMGFEWRIGELPKHLRSPNTNYIDYVELRFNPSKSKLRIDRLPKIKKRKYPF